MTDPFIHLHPSYMEIKEWQNIDPNLIAGFTTRLKGNSEEYYASLNMGLHVHDDPNRVINNREILADAIGFPLQNWVSGQQVHGTTIRKVTSADKAMGSTSMDTAIQGVDGIYTDEPGILLTAFFADCVPIFYFSPMHGLIGIAHGGWKGTVGGIGSKMVRNWVEVEGVDPKDIFVTIGPAICEACYEVDQRIIEQVKLPNNDLKKTPYTKTSETHYTLDLKQLNRQLLLNGGVIDQHIHITQHCTSCETNLFYSHRKEEGKTGRMLGFIGRKEK